MLRSAAIREECADITLRVVARSQPRPNGEPTMYTSMLEQQHTGGLLRPKKANRHLEHTGPSF